MIKTITILMLAKLVTLELLRKKFFKISILNVQTLNIPFLPQRIELQVE